MPRRSLFTHLSEKERLLLIANVLEFFLVTEEHQGRRKGELKDEPQFAAHDISELYDLVDVLTQSQLIWRRGDGPNTIYATDVIGRQTIAKYREEAGKL